MALTKISLSHLSSWSRSKHSPEYDSTLGEISQLRAKFSKTFQDVSYGQKFRQFRTHLHHILVSTVQICKPMIHNNVEKFRPIHGLSFTQQSNFYMLNNFLRNQLKKAASVTDFSSTSVKNGLFEKILLQN